MTALLTPRLELVPVTLAMVQAVFREDRQELERLAGAPLPTAWPGRMLVERAFSASLEAIIADPDVRLWGDRMCVLRPPEPRRIVGSVVFHGRPGADGVAEIAYGIEEGSQRRGLATEAVSAAVEWALAQPGIEAVQATTLPWHTASIRVLEKVDMERVGTREHELLGELIVFARRRSSS
jgi:ribosomal-protein-alanine N-acetyltransferase